MSAPSTSSSRGGPGGRRLLQEANPGATPSSMNRSPTRGDTSAIHATSARATEATKTLASQLSTM